MTINFVGDAIRLTPAAVSAAAHALRCEPAAVWAVCDVEAAGGGFLPDKRPKILYEAQVFGRLTAHKWDKSNPNISSPIWNRSLYGAPGAHQYDRLSEAMKLDETAALEAASWGMFQVLGLNHAVCGFATPQDMVSAFVKSEEAHLAAFVAFCRANALDTYLRTHQWARFALRYNGAGYRDNDYDGKLEAAYQKRATTA